MMTKRSAHFDVCLLKNTYLCDIKANFH